jgi:hypothetical protein
VISTENEQNHRPARCDSVTEQIRADRARHAGRVSGRLVRAHQPNTRQRDVPSVGRGQAKRAGGEPARHAVSFAPESREPHGRATALPGLRRVPVTQRGRQARRIRLLRVLPGSPSWFTTTIRRPVAARAASRYSTPPKAASRSRCSTTIPLTSGIGQDPPQLGAVAGHTRPDLGHRRIQRDPPFTGLLTRPDRPVAPHHHAGQRTKHDISHSSPAGLGG